jgi:hypothetical protein
MKQQRIWAARAARFVLFMAVLGLVGDDITGFQSGRIHFPDQYQIAGIEVGFAHGVGKNDKCLVTKNIAVGTVKSVDGDNGEDHHGNRYSNDHPHKNGGDNVPNLFHRYSFALGIFYQQQHKNCRENFNELLSLL